MASPPGSSADDPRLEVDPGPEFAAADDEERQEHDQPEQPVDLDEGPLEEISEETVRSALRAQGRLLHVSVAADRESDEWLWLADELDDIVPPLTRIINRYEPLRRLAVAGDWLPVFTTLGAYGARSMRERGLAHARLRALEEEERAASGQAAFRVAGAEGPPAHGAG